MSEEKIFIGNAKEVNDFLIGGSICLTDIMEKAKEHITQSDSNGKKYIRVNIVKKRNPDDRSTHYIAVNTWKPQQQQSSQSRPQAQEPVQQSFNDDDVPF